MGEGRLQGSLRDLEKIQKGGRGKDEPGTDKGAPGGLSQLSV